MTITLLTHLLLFCLPGDLLAALLLARLHQTPNDLKMAVELALASLQHIVLKTYESSTSHLSKGSPLPEASSSCANCNEELPEMAHD